jgi:uncharacterized protein (UPF0303 family)
MTSDDLIAEAAKLILTRFDDNLAFTLGTILVSFAQAESLPVVINIRTADRTLFHAALPGSAPLNDIWARRKSNVALMFQKSSLLVGTEMQQKGSRLANDGLTDADYADHGGAVPIWVQGVGMVAVATVSGLPQRDDHALVVRAIEALQLSL